MINTEELLSILFSKYRVRTLNQLATCDTLREDLNTLLGDFVGLAVVGERLLAISTEEVVGLTLDNDWSLQFYSSSYIFNGVRHDKQ